MTPTEELHDDVLDAIPDGVPIVMVNLMKFKSRSDDGDGSGWDAYVRYSKATSPLIKARGGAIIWAGQASGAAFGPSEFGDCDYVALVRYPSTAAFREMIVSAEYEPGNVHRMNGVEQHVIIATQESYGRFRKD